MRWPRLRGEDLSALTGTHCPQTGLWAPSQEHAGQVQLAKGSLMPARNGTPVLWIYHGRTLSPGLRSTFPPESQEQS